MDDCIETDWSKCSAGYGRKRVDGVWWKHHRRVMLELHVPIDGMVVRHRCDNPSCVNSDHLTVGTTADNMRDMVARGRSRRGELQNTAKLTAADVLRIRDAALKGEATQGELAVMYGVSQPTVSRAVLRKTWGHIQ